MSEPEELLGFTLEALDEIDAIVGRGHSGFAASLDRQEPSSSSIRFRDRIAHQSLSQLDDNVLWRVSTERVSELRAILISLRTAGQ